MTMTLLDYSTTNKEIDRLPVTESKRKFSGAVKKIFFWTASTISILASFIYGWSLNNEVGLLLTAFACVPLAALVTISLWLAPRSEVSLPLRLLAIIWGGVAATNGTLIIVDIIGSIFGTPDLNTTVVVQAAVVEEFCKALFIFGLFFWCKQLVRTPLAGAALGIMVGGGFAFIENIMYFNNAFLQGGWASLWSTIALRAGMSFFLHAMATMFTGMFIGYVVSKRTELNFWRKISFLDMGLVAAMTVHGMWNGMASLSTDNGKWMILYLCFWIPFVALMTVTLVIVRKTYIADKANTIISAARRGYIRMSQAEKITDKKARKALYKTSSSSDIVSWESSLLKIQHWNDSIAVAKKDKRIRRLNKAKSRQMRKLAQVVSKV
jgi:RsiW-degrading membrane proteinase PrsW (M82 family)